MSSRLWWIAPLLVGNPPQSAGHGPSLSDFAALVQNVATSLTNPNQPFDGQRVGLDRQYNQSLAAPGSNPSYLAPSMSPGNFSGLRHGNTGSAEKSSNYSRNSYNESSHEHKRDYDSKSKREYDQQRDHLDNHGDNFNRNIYKQEESNRGNPYSILLVCKYFD